MICECVRILPKYKILNAKTYPYRAPLRRSSTSVDNSTIEDIEDPADGPETAEEAAPAPAPRRENIKLKTIMQSVSVMKIFPTKRLLQVRWWNRLCRCCILD